MQKKPHLKLVLALFSVLMALIYIGIGCYIIFGNRQFVDQIVNPSLLKMFGVVLLIIGSLRGFRAYQLINIYRNANQ